MAADPPITGTSLSEASLLEGLRPSARHLLRQLLMYKSVFMGATFRDLAQDQPPEVRDVLVRLHTETIAESAAIALAMRAWDAHPASGEGLELSADEARRRFLEDILALKDGVVDVGLSAAMRAPTDELRRRFLALTDMDREHADELRRLLHVPTVRDHLDTPPDAAAPVSVGRGRDPGSSFSRTIERALDGLASRGIKAVGMVMSPEALRHARDEGLVDPSTGRAFGIPVDVDMGWGGECWAIHTGERVGYAELITAAARLRSTGDPT